MTNDLGLRAVLAARLSVATDDSMSIGNQLKADAAEAARRGFAVVGDAIDEDISGSIDPFQRPGLGEWLRLERGPFDVMIFAKLDRASRDTLDALTLLNWFQKSGRRLILLDPYIDSASMTSIQRMHFVMSAEMAAYEREEIRKRTMIGVRGARLEGKWPGGRIPFWCDQFPHPSGKGKAIRVNEARAVLALRIIDAVLSGTGKSTIAKALNAEGVKTPDQLRMKVLGERPRKKRGLKPQWTDATIRQICSNRLLLGEREVVKREKGAKGANNGRVISREIIRDDLGKAVKFCSPIIDAATFARLQKALKTRDAATSDRIALQGVVKCVHCGNPMYRRTGSARKTKERPYYYVCGHRQRYASCTSASVFCNVTHEALDRWVRAEIGAQEIYDRIDPPAEDYSSRLIELRDRIEANKKVLAVLKSESMMASTLDQIAVDDEEVSRLEIMERNPPKPEYVPTGRIFGDMWDSADWHARGNLLRSLGVTMEVGLVEGAFVGHVRMPGDISERLRAVTSGRAVAPVAHSFPHPATAHLSESRKGTVKASTIAVEARTEVE